MKIIKTETPFADFSNGKPKRFTQGILTRSVPIAAAILIVTCCSIKQVSGDTPAGVIYRANDEGCCSICMDTKVDKGCQPLKPCGHAGFCRKCIKQIRKAGDNTCPFCRKNITGLGARFTPTPPKHNDQHHHGAAKISQRACWTCDSVGQQNVRCDCGGRFTLPLELICHACDGAGKTGALPFGFDLFGYCMQNCGTCGGDKTIRNPHRRPLSSGRTERRRFLAAMCSNCPDRPNAPSKPQAASA